MLHLLMIGWLALSLFPGRGNWEEAKTAEVSDSLLVVFWNLENFFDYEDSGRGDSDAEFSPEGSRHWSASRFYRKCNLISKSILWIASRHGRIPDVIGVAEVENKTVLSRLLSGSALRKMGYRTVHYDSPDHRGIDVALFYRKSTFNRLSSRPIPLRGMATRDLLDVHLSSLQSSRNYHFIVCHLPSKYGGKASEPRRYQAAAVLRESIDSIRTLAPEDGVVVMGDFNDVPEAAAFDTLRPAVQLVYPQAWNSERKSHLEGRAPEGKGSIRFNGKWEWIDLFWTASVQAEMEVVKVPFLMVPDSSFPGEKPLRTYSGPRFLGGVSDHCPILLEIEDSR